MCVLGSLRWVVVRGFRVSYIISWYFDMQRISMGWSMPLQEWYISYCRFPVASKELIRIEPLRAGHAMMFGPGNCNSYTEFIPSRFHIRGTIFAYAIQLWCLAANPMRLLRTTCVRDRSFIVVRRDEINSSRATKRMVQTLSNAADIITAGLMARNQIWRSACHKWAKHEQLYCIDHPRPRRHQCIFSDIPETL